MAGPGIRYHYVGELLSKNFDVTLGFFDPTALPDEDFERSYKVLHIDAVQFESGFKDADYIFTLWLNDAMMNFCNIHKKVVIFDIYAPVPVEALAVVLFSQRKISPEDDFEYNSSLTMYQKFLENGDLFVCSNPRQVDFWQGYIFAGTNITPTRYLKRPLYDRFINAPMGIDTTKKLVKKHATIRNVIGTISDTDTIILWTGGIWDWFDGITLMNAMALLKTTHPHIKLVFYGTQHPNSAIPKMAESVQTRERAATLKLLDNTVYFLDGWVDYYKRFDYFLEADIAIYAHKPSIEMRFSHRTRVLDHFLAELPTVGTKGDYLGEIIEKHELGIMVEPGDAEALAKAIIECATPENQKKFRQNIGAIKPEFDWTQTLKPLEDFLLNNPTKLPLLPLSTPLQKDSLARIKRVVPKPLKRLIKRFIQSV